MADLQNIFYQIVLSILRDSKFSSASKGHINKFEGVTGAQTSIGTDQEIRDAIAEIVSSLEDGVSDNLGDVSTTAQGMGKKSEVDNVLSIAKAGLGPVDVLQTYARKLVPMIIPLLVAAGMAEVVMETMLSPGGLFDRRLRRMITQEVNGLLDKQTQKNFSIGTRQLIIQSRAGFRNIQGIGSEDSLRQIREGTGAGLRKSNLDYIDFSKGVREIRE